MSAIDRSKWLPPCEGDESGQFQCYIAAYPLLLSLKVRLRQDQELQLCSWLHLTGASHKQVFLVQPPTQGAVGV